MYKISCKMNKKFLRYSMFFHQENFCPFYMKILYIYIIDNMCLLAPLPALRFPKKPSVGMVKSWSSHIAIVKILEPFRIY